MFLGRYKMALKQSWKMATKGDFFKSGLQFFIFSMYIASGTSLDSFYSSLGYLSGKFQTKAVPSSYLPLIRL